MNEFTPVELAKLADYLADVSDEAERARIERWKKESPERDRFLTMLARSRIDYSAATAETIVDLPAHLQTLSKNLTESIRTAGAQENPVISDVRSRAPSMSQRFWYEVGGIVTVLAILISGWHIGAHRTDRVNGNQVSTYTTGNSQRATVRLPDGTFASLNVGSRLEVPTNYGSGNRTVTLVGEALFTVVHHADEAFAVKAGHSITRVLGTSFVVRHYQADTATTVAVRDGKVSVGSMVLRGGEQIVVTAGRTQRTRLMDDGIFSFARGVLTLSDMPLAQAIPQLNRWYDVEIRLGDSTLATQGVNGVFKPGSVVDVASILELTFDVRIVREGRILTLYQRN